MKKIGMFLIGVMLSGLSFAGSSSLVTMADRVVSTNTVAGQNTDLTLDLNNYDFAQASLQLNYSLNSTVLSFNDGMPSTATFTIGSNNLIGTGATNYITLPATALLLPTPATNQITVVNTNIRSTDTITLRLPLPYGDMVFKNVRDFVCDTASSCATNITNKINASQQLVIATNNTTGTIIYATAAVAGSPGNNFQFLSSTPTILSTGSVSFNGGNDGVLNNAVLTLNTTVGRYNFLMNRDWPITDTSTGSAVVLKNVLATIPELNVSTGANSVIATTATIANGSAANSWTMSSNNPYLVVAGAKFSGGIDNAIVYVGTNTFTQGVNWTAGANAGATATLLASTIAAKAPVACAAVGSVVTCTNTVPGVQGNLIYWADNTLSIIASGSLMTGGVDPLYSAKNGYFTVLNSSVAAGQQMYLAKTAGTVPLGLTLGATYYGVPRDFNTFYISDTSSGSLAGVIFKSTQTTAAGGGVFQFYPVALTGTVTMIPKVSNDGVNFSTTAVTLTGISWPSTYTAGNTYWDIGSLNPRWLQVTIAGITQGGFRLKALLNGRR
jgi:hypothetical protein